MDGPHSSGNAEISDGYGTAVKIIGNVPNLVDGACSLKKAHLGLG
jgi:hypothetical protein